LEIKMKRRSLPQWCMFVLIVCETLFALKASAHPLVHFWQNRSLDRATFLLEPRISLFSTNENYLSDGTSAVVPGLNSYRQVYGDLNAAYAIDPAWTVFGRLSLQQTTIDALGRSISKVGLGDQLLGAAVRIHSLKNGGRITIQAEALLPAYSNANSKLVAEPFAGDGAVEVTGGTFVELPLGSGTRAWMIEGGAGLTYRSYGYSAHAPVSLLIKRTPVEPGFLVHLGALGQISFQSDSSSLAQAASDTAAGAAGSLAINAVNPTWLALRAGLGYRLSQSSDVMLQGIVPVLAQNSPKGVAIAMGYTYTWPSQSSASASASSASESAPSRKPDRKKFRTYVLEAVVSGLNEPLNLIKIDKGRSSGVEVGQLFDLFEEGSGERIARARVTHVKDSEAALAVVEYYKDSYIDPGAKARRLP
jgi:hypothetical protein